MAGCGRTPAGGSAAAPAETAAADQTVPAITTEISGIDLAQLEKATVKRVVDGDTLVISTGERVRLIGIDTPETVKPNSPVEYFGKEASAFSKSKLDQQTIYLEKDISDTDKYGRLLRYVYLADGTFFNLLLVREGYANAVSYPPDVKYGQVLRQAEKTARANEKGLWRLNGEKK